MKTIAMIAYSTLSTDARVIREALAAQEAGFSVDIFVLNEPAKIDLPGIKVYYTKSFQYKGGNKIRFIWSYVSFFLFCFFQITSRFLSRKYKIIHVNNMPDFLVFSCIIPKIFGTKIILDVHDLVPELFAEKFHVPLDHLIIKLLYFEERISCWFADIVISTNRLHTKRFRDNGICKDQFPEILNAADENIFTPFTGHAYDSNEIKLIFPTTIARRLGIDTLLAAMEIISKKTKLIHLEIYGGGEYSGELVKKIEQLALGKQVYFSKCFIPFETLAEKLESAHIGVIPWPANYSTNYQMPMKIHEYFIKGLCVVAADVNIIKEYFSGCVELFRAGDPEDLAEKILALADDRKRMKDLAGAGYNFFQNNSWSVYKKRYQDLLNSL